MVALHPECPVGEHKVLISPQSSNIGRLEESINFYSHGRFQKYKIYTETFGVIDFRHGQSRVNWNVSQMNCVIFLVDYTYIPLT